MVKHFYLTYGAQDVAVDELGYRIAALLGMKAELRNSLYVGEYVNCLGSQADKLTIESDMEGDGTPKLDEEPFCNYSVFVEASNYRGKNSEKELRHLGIKEFFATSPDLVLLKETVLETEN